jgi:hypothetical protein
LSLTYTTIIVNKFSRYKAPGVDRIPAELIQTGSKTLRSEIHKLINYIWNMKKLPQEWEVSIVPMDKKATQLIVVNIENYQLLTT